MTAAQPNLFSERVWRDPWEAIQGALTPALESLGIGHVYLADDGTLRFLTLPRRCLLALDELRMWRDSAALQEPDWRAQ